MNAVYYRATLLCQALFIQEACMLLLLVRSVRLHIVNTESTGQFLPRNSASTKVEIWEQ